MIALESTKSPTSNTAIPRILEEEKSSLRADKVGAAIHKGKSQKVDSRFFTQTAQSLSTPQGKKAESVFSNQPQAAGFLMKSAINLKTQQDSRISKETSPSGERYPLFCDEKPLLYERVQRRILGACNRSARDAIKDLSRKAESTSPTPTLKPSQRRPK